MIAFTIALSIVCACDTSLQSESASSAIWVAPRPSGRGTYGDSSLALGCNDYREHQYCNGTQYANPQNPRKSNMVAVFYRTCDLGDPRLLIVQCDPLLNSSMGTAQLNASDRPFERSSAWEDTLIVLDAWYRDWEVADFGSGG